MIDNSSIPNFDALEKGRNSDGFVKMPRSRLAGRGSELERVVSKLISSLRRTFMFHPEE